MSNSPQPPSPIPLSVANLPGRSARVWEDTAEVIKRVGPAMQANVNRILADPVAELYQLREVDYVREPVSVETFIYDNHYLGRSLKGNVFPAIVDDLVELFEGNYLEVCLGGCVALDEMVQEADGNLPTLAEVMGKRTELGILTDDGQRFASTGPVSFSGIKKVVKLTLANGMAVKLTPEHRVRVWRDGGYCWVEAGNLQATDLVICSRRLSTRPTSSISDDEAKLLGYFTGNGSASFTRARYCAQNVATSQEVQRLLKRLGFAGSDPYPKDGSWEVSVRKVKHSGFLAWLKAQGDRTLLSDE